MVNQEILLRLLRRNREYVGIDQATVETVLQSHLDDVDAIAKALGKLL